MARLLLPEGSAYTFADYFRLNADVEDVLSYFGYVFESKLCSLPRASLSLERLADIKLRLEESMPYISLTSEIARREFLIAPVLLEVIHYTHTKVRVEFPLYVTDKLQGTLDYFLQKNNNIVIIEAKNADLQRGFTQLAVEMVALDSWIEAPAEQIYGAVSLGNVWQFGFLQRSARRVTQDLNLYRVPADVEDVLRILIALLGETEP